MPAPVTLAITTTQDFMGIEIRVVEAEKGHPVIPLVDIARGIGYLPHNLAELYERNQELLKDDAQTPMIITGNQVAPVPTICLTREGVIGILMKLDYLRIKDPAKKQRILDFQKWAKKKLAEMQIQAQLPVKETIVPTGRIGDVISRHFEVARALHREMGTPLDLAMSKALFTSGKELGMNLTPYSYLMPPAQITAGATPAIPAHAPADPYKSAGEIANILNRRDGTHLRAKNINKYLKTRGYIYENDEGRKCMTDLGAQYGKLFPFVANNGHAGYYIRWHERILIDAGLIRGE